MNKKRALKCILMIGLVFVISNGYAQVARSFPVDSRFGKLKSHSYPEFKIDKVTLIMGAGGQIRDRHNLLVMPPMLTKKDHKGYIRYQMDNMGLLHRVWFLTPEETQLAQEEEKLLKKQNPQKKFSIPFFQ
ncbi:hypothetical protein SAMN05216326_1066 [Nitrosomonas marina]|uniref:Uncharacterized protein n=1 Tax=Nitrosomonas marina TaxID=917 RepID=A0A1I0A2D0_9PROT|nr:hypothetical protein [Nitrosomonas marina]SES88297.1 hypothetical protein SAMN05216326_1066 [Nitrosomonas marina]